MSEIETTTKIPAEIIAPSNSRVRNILEQYNLAVTASKDNWAEDNCAGNMIALALIDLLREQKTVTAYGAIMREMCLRGRYSGIEVGFSFTMAQFLSQV